MPVRKGRRLLLTVVLVLLIAVAGVAVWQRDSLSALYYAATMSEDELLQRMDDRQQEQNERMAELGVEVPAPSKDDLAALFNGTMTEEELFEQLGLGQWLTESGKNEAAGSTAKPGDKMNAPPSYDGGQKPGVSAESLYNQCVAELYACQSSVMAQLGGIRADAIARWESLPPESRTTMTKREIGFDALDACYGLEGTVDGQVQEILNRYRPQIAAAGGDAGALDGLWSYYVSLKNSEKAYYVNQYM